MINTTTRIFIVVIFVGLLATSSYVLPQWLKPKRVQTPEWNLAAMPLQFGSWQQAEVEVDPEVRDKILLDADAVVDRAYRDNQNHVVSLHAALFSDLDTGVRHSPINCYRGNGWREVDRKNVDLVLPDQSSIPVCLTTWEREGQRVLVMYWYQLDEYILFGRWDLFWTRLAMQGKETWPAMVKVLLQTRADDKDEAERRIQTIAVDAYQWINQPGHRASLSSPDDQASIEQDQPGRLFDKTADPDYNARFTVGERFFLPASRQESGTLAS
jgi:EpsI family protein